MIGLYRARAKEIKEGKSNRERIESRRLKELKNVE